MEEQGQGYNVGVGVVPSFQLRLFLIYRSAVPSTKEIGEYYEVLDTIFDV